MSPADLVIKALGFDPEALPALWEQPGLEVSRWGTIKTDHRTAMTSAAGCFRGRGHRAWCEPGGVGDPGRAGCGGGDARFHAGSRRCRWPRSEAGGGPAVVAGWRDGRGCGAGLAVAPAWAVDTDDPARPLALKVLNPPGMRGMPLQIIASAEPDLVAKLRAAGCRRPMRVRLRNR